MYLSFFKLLQGELNYSSTSVVRDSESNSFTRLSLNVIPFRDGRTAGAIVLPARLTLISIPFRESVAAGARLH